MKHTSDTDSFDEYRRRMEAEGHHIAMQPIQLSPGRYPLPKPYPATWSIDRQIVEAVREGNKAIDEEEKKSSKPNSVESDHSTAVQDALGKMEKSPYARAQTQLLEKMSPALRSVMEAMIRGDVPKDKRYNDFMQQVSAIGDKLTNN